MFIDFIAANAPAIIAAVVFVPVLVLSIALFVEGARKTRWTVVSRRNPARPKAMPRAASSRATRATSAHGLRHGIAARRDHD
jgi:hypothetical protein